MKKLSKRIITMIVIGVLLLSTLAACGQKSKDNAGNSTGRLEMEDSKDSILDMSAEAVAEIEALKAENEKLRADYADLKERYKMRFLEGADVVEEVEEEKAEEEPKEEEVIDIKEI